MAYFGPVLYLVLFCLMSLLLAVVVDECDRASRARAPASSFLASASALLRIGRYLQSARRQVRQEEHKERKGLLKACA